MFELTNEILIRILIFLITFFISFNILNRIFKQKFPEAIISLAISLIAVFYITPNQISIVNEIYGTMGTILLITIPFLISFFLVYSSNIIGTLRKIFWIFYGSLNILFLQKQNAASPEAILIAIILISIILFFDTNIKNAINIRKNLKKS